MMPTDQLTELLRRAIDRRSRLLAGLDAEGTDCYRLFHGVAEGAPGLTFDRYGSVLLAQTFRDPLPIEALAALRTVANRELGLDLPAAGVHRQQGSAAREGAHRAPPALSIPADLPLDHECREARVRFAIRTRHRGQDPWLFLDLRAGRRRVREMALGKTVLNLFAYTCGVGIVAASAGASAVLNVDFAGSALAVGRDNAARNQIDPARCAFLHADCLPVLRQFAGQPVQRRHRSYARVERRRFDLIVLDPPRFAKTPFGTIDVRRDYQSLFKPSLLSLEDGGAVLATNHVPSVSAAAWHEALGRCADKAGRPLRALEPIAIDDDFPSFDGQPPLKIVLARV